MSTLVRPTRGDLQFALVLWQGKEISEVTHLRVRNTETLREVYRLIESKCFGLASKQCYFLRVVRTNTQKVRFLRPSVVDGVKALGYGEWALKVGDLLPMYAQSFVMNENSSSKAWVRFSMLMNLEF